MKICEPRSAASLATVCLVLFFAEASIGQDGMDAETDRLILAGIELSIQHDYSQAEAIFQQLIQDYPEHPFGYFYMAATIQAKMMDYESDQWEHEFYRYIHLAIEIAERKRLAERDTDAWSMFYHGSALCYLAFHEGRKGDYWNAVNHGLAGVSILKKLTKSHPDCHDAYFGIGSYQYWRSQKTKFLNWLPFISDERNQGISLVQRAIEKGHYTRYAAMNELIWMLLDAGQLEAAYQWAEAGLTRFPDSRFFLWGAAKSAMALGNYSDAAIHFQRLLASLLNSPIDNEYNEYICRVKLAQCFVQLGKLSDAADQVELLDSLPLSAEMEKKLKKQRMELHQLKLRLATLPQMDVPRDSLFTKHKFADKQRRQ